jgi:hypothetical protein
MLGGVASVRAMIWPGFWAPAEPAPEAQSVRDAGFHLTTGPELAASTAKRQKSAHDDDKSCNDERHRVYS